MRHGLRLAGALGCGWGWFTPAQASFLQGEALGTMANVMSYVVLVLV
jgi:hypothetical protein